jgi:hypothetical protein
MDNSGNERRTVEHLNYCRQATQALQNAEMTHPQSDVRRDCTTALNAMQKASKFLLPDGGECFQTPSFVVLMA